MKKSIIVLCLFIIIWVFAYALFFYSWKQKEINYWTWWVIISVNKIESKDTAISDFQKNADAYKNGKKVFSPEIKTIFKNIKKYLQNRTDQTLTEDEIYYRIANILLFPFIDWSNSCQKLAKEYWIANEIYFLKECNFTFEYKRSLQTHKVDSIPEYLFKHNHIFPAIKTNICKEWLFNCALLFDDSLTKKDFFKQILDYKDTKNIQKEIGNLSPVDYLLYWFFESTDKIRKNKDVDKVLELFYEGALYNKAIYKNNIEICNEILSVSNKKYCYDILKWENKEYYKKLFEEFHIYLYLYVDEV